MTSPLEQLAVLGPLAVLLTLAGGLIPLIRVWRDDHLHGFVSFSAGILVATAFLHLLPEAVERTDPSTAGLCILLSFTGFFILEKFIMLHPCEESHCDYHHIGIAAFVGMTFHTFFDGLALGSALMVPKLGLIVFFAIMAHKIPSSFSLASILKKARWPNGRSVIAILILGAVIPAGALASVFALKGLNEQVVGIAIAVSLGTFIYIATSDFLPEVHRAHETRFKNLAFFLAGIAVLAISSIFLPHV